MSVIFCSFPSRSAHDSSGRASFANLASLFSILQLMLSIFDKNNRSTKSA
jgi:hypothetical protein